MSAPERHRPFSNGSDFSDWKDANCERCTLRYVGNTWRCKLEQALDFACIEDGTIDAEIAKRLGCDTSKYGYPSRVCPERPEGTA